MSNEIKWVGRKRGNISEEGRGRGRRNGALAVTDRAAGGGATKGWSVKTHD